MTSKERDIIKQAAAIIAREVLTQKVIIRGFGTFKQAHKKARICRNPQKPGETIDVPAKDYIKFTAAN